MRHDSEDISACGRGGAGCEDRGRGVDAVGRSTPELHDGSERPEIKLAGAWSEGAVEATARRGILVAIGGSRRTIHDVRAVARRDRDRDGRRYGEDALGARDTHDFPQ